MKAEKVKKLITSYAELTNEKPYIIYGTGEIAEVFTEEIIRRFGRNAIAYYINGTVQPNQCTNGKTVIHYSELEKISVNDFQYILATISKSACTMKERLLQAGVFVENILPVLPYFNTEDLKSALGKVNKIVVLPEFHDKKALDKFWERTSVYIDRNDYPIEMKCFLKSQNEQVDINKKDTLLLITKAEEIEEMVKKYPGIHTFCIDENILLGLFQKMFLVLADYMTDERETEKISKENFKKIIKAASNCKGIGVFGNGPSLSEGVEKYKDLIKHTFNIVCNSIYQVEEVIQKINPCLYVLSDISYIDDEKEEMQEIANYVNSHNCYLAVSRYQIPILINYYKVKKEKLIGFFFERDEVIIPHVDNMKVCVLGTALLTLAFPIACALHNNVFVFGCDGSANIEETQWNYSPEINIHKNVDTSKKVFSTLDITDNTFIKIMIEGYRKMFEKISSNTKIYTLTPSYFKELAEYYVENYQ